MDYFEYKGTLSTSKTITQEKQTFENKLKNYCPSDKEHKIIMHIVDDFHQIEYIKSIGIIAWPKTKMFASRIANICVCIFVITKNILNKLGTGTIYKARYITL